MMHDLVSVGYHLQKLYVRSVPLYQKGKVLEIMFLVEDYNKFLFHAQ